MWHLGAGICWSLESGAGSAYYQFGPEVLGELAESGHTMSGLDDVSSKLGTSEIQLTRHSMV